MAEIKRAKITISGDNPIEISEEIEEDISALDESQQKTISQIGETVKAYRDAATELLSGKYIHLKDWAPTHLSNPGYILVAISPDSIVLRFEQKKDKAGILTGWFPGDLFTIAPLLSQGVVRCYLDNQYTSEVPTKGIEIKLISGNPVTKEEKIISAFRIGFDVVVKKPEDLPKHPSKPYCLLSIRNFFEIHIEGILGENNSTNNDRKRFLTRSAMRLPVGWDCIEIYPFFESKDWKPEFAPLWAEHDLLAAVVASQFRETQFQSLDPKASAREQYAELLNEYKKLLDSKPDREEILQVFLANHPELLSPTKTRMWSKLALGNRKTDFVFQEASSDYILVELERSTYQLFNKDGHTSRDLNHAHGQILDWKRYLEDNLSTAQRELGLTGISANPKSLLVIGRSENLTPDNRRKLTTMENESPKLKIMTYDDVYENAKSVVENLLGPIWEVAGNTRVYYLPS